MEKFTYVVTLIILLLILKWTYGEVTNSMLIATNSLVSTFVLLDAMNRRRG